eukprot:TRINITY_DN10368_c0_g1_i1.p1 TRINITY_DN10368_c0_g1~~TRINITY_DN10368_c0_g1_i1.p1  ORF type:complete len:215 (-),score=19.93 TRINITY_DN10368_c0_g1_i1:284-928(-)
MTTTAVLSSRAGCLSFSSSQSCSKSPNAGPKCTPPVPCRRYDLFMTRRSQPKQLKMSEHRHKGFARAASVDIEKIEIKKGEGRGLAREGEMAGGRWLSSTTRHVRIYIGYVDPETHEMDQQQADLVTIDLDPDNEFLWPEDKQQKVFDFFDEQVENYRGAPMDEYTLRLIGSEIEHFIRKLLVAGEIKYNLNCRVLNFSMGKPHIEGVGDEESQ